MKKNWNLRSGLFFILLIIQYGHSFAEDDFQYWNTESAEITLKNRIKIKVTEEFRFQDNASQLYHYFTEIGIGRSLNEWFDLSLEYRHINEKKENKWMLENRPQISGTINLKWHRLTIKDRNRFEYRIQENSDNTWRYRNRLSVELPCKWTSMQIQPYTADEIFFDFIEKKINRNRVYFGLKMKPLKFLKGDIYYLWQSSKKTEWIDFHIVGTKIQLTF